MMKDVFKTLLFFSFLLLFAFSKEPQVDKKSNVSLQNFAKIIVSDGGRLKPMQSLAMNYLLAFSGRSAYDGKSAEFWLAKVLFDSENTRDEKIFRIDNLDFIHAIDLKKEVKNLYSFNQLEPYGKDIERFYIDASHKPKESRNAFDNAVLKTYVNLVDYFYLTSAFSFTQGNNFIRLEDKKLKQQLGLDLTRDSFSYIELREKKEALEKLKSSSSKESKHLIDAYEMMSKEYEEYPIHLLALKMPGKDEVTWVSAWQVFSINPYQESSLESEIKLLSDLAYSYKQGDFKAFDENIEKFNEKVSNTLRLQGQSGVANKIKMEIFYNKMNAFLWAKVVFVLAFLSICFFLLKNFSFLRWISIIASFLAIILVFIGLSVRIYISGRAPVTNLYETFVFVALGTAFFSTIVELYKKNGIGAFTAAFCGFSFLMFSDGFVKGDTMPVLAAVLRNNFWLTTHVVTITIGYVGMIITGIIGHFFIFMAMKYPLTSPKLNEISQMIKGSLAFSFIFSSMGTILGGIWADQSWGRFWGWDPKENGALLIVLWILILFHAKAGKIIKDLGFAIGSVFGMVVTVLAWLGVNFLSVGLHSYGFTEGVSKGLLFYIAIQIIFLYLAFILVLRRQKILNPSK